jgi:hypothetical protein
LMGAFGSTLISDIIGRLSAEWFHWLISFKRTGINCKICALPLEMSSIGESVVCQSVKITKIWDCGFELSEEGMRAFCWKGRYIRR